jgi:6-phosphogluconolactonase
MVVRLALWLCLLWVAARPAVAKDGAFKVWAPSSQTGTLWVIDATPDGEGLKLSLFRKVPLGFAGRVITAHAAKPLLYLGASNGETGKTPFAVVTLNSAGDYEKHQPIELQDGAAFISLDRRNAFLLTVSYGNGRFYSYPLDEQGIPGPAVSSMDEARKEAHCILTSPNNQFLYIPYVKGNLALYQYRFDAATGKITPLEPKNANPPVGTGPRHLAYHPAKPMVYFSNEQGIGLSTYRQSENGQLTLAQNIEVLPAGVAKEGLSASDLEITPDGKFLFAGLRGHQQDFDKITRYRIKDNGEAELLGLTNADKIPWGLAISPDGRFLLVSATTGSTLTAYRISENGDLNKVASLNWDSGISDLITR